MASWQQTTSGSRLKREGMATDCSKFTLTRAGISHGDDNRLARAAASVGAVQSLTIAVLEHGILQCSQQILKLFNISE